MSSSKIPVSNRPQVYKRITALLLTSPTTPTSPLPASRIALAITRASKPSSLLPAPFAHPPKTPQGGYKTPTVIHPYRGFLARLKREDAGPVMRFEYQVLHVEYTRFITLMDQVKGLSLDDALVQLRFHRKPITRHFTRAFEEGIVKAKESGLDLERTFVADVYAHENGGIYNKVMEKKLLFGRARYGSSPHFKSTLLKFTFQQREKAFVKREGDPLEWVRERMREKLGGGEKGLASVVYERVREARPVKVVYS